MSGCMEHRFSEFPSSRVPRCSCAAWHPRVPGRPRCQLRPRGLADGLPSFVLFPSGLCSAVSEPTWLELLFATAVSSLAVGVCLPLGFCGGSGFLSSGAYFHLLFFPGISPVPHSQVFTVKWPCCSLVPTACGPVPTPNRVCASSLFILLLHDKILLVLLIFSKNQLWGLFLDLYFLPSC